MASVGNNVDMRDKSSRNSADYDLESKFEGFDAEDISIFGNVQCYTDILNPNYDRESPIDVESIWL